MNYEGLFEAMLQRSVDGIVLTELPSRRILAVSNSFCDLTGYSHEELIDGVLTDLGILRLDEVSIAIKRTAAGLRGMYEFRMIQKDGRQRWVEISAQLWQPTRLVMIVRDITERLNEQARLRLLGNERKAPLETGYEEFFDAILRQSVDAIVFLERESRRFIEFSDSWCVMTGFTREELRGHTGLELGLVRAGEKAVIDRRVAAGPDGVFEIRMWRKDGEPRWLEFSNQRLGANLELSIARDVTERHASGRARRRL